VGTLVDMSFSGMEVENCLS